MFGEWIGKLLLKQAVGQNVCNHILVSDTDIDAATYQKKARHAISAGAATEETALSLQRAGVLTSESPVR